MTDDEHWMQKAILLAQFAATKGEVPIGAIVVHENKIIGEGWNQPIVSNDPSAHAEVIALRDAAKTIQNYRILEATLYVTLEPCLMCIGTMLHARISRLVFGAFDSKIGAGWSVFDVLSDAKHNHTIEITGGTLKEECGDILQTFFKARR